MAGINRISSASALAALSISVSAIAQQAPAADPPKARKWKPSSSPASARRSPRASRTSANSTQVVESIVAEDIGKLPDNNVIEALQRVTGVQITNRGGGEAEGIVDSRPARHHHDLERPQRVHRFAAAPLALQDIPANLVGRIDVFKTRASEQLETGLAGQIDVRTRRPSICRASRCRSTLAPPAGAARRHRSERQLPGLQQWDGGDGRFGALVNVSYRADALSRSERDRRRAGAVRHGDNPPLGYGAAADNCPQHAAGQSQLDAARAHLQRRLPRTRSAQPDPLLWQAGTRRRSADRAGLDAHLQRRRSIPICSARDALFASDFQGDRERPAANVALQWAPNDNSEYTFEAFYQGYREEMFNNLHFTFADWWGTLGPNPASTITMYPGTNLIKTRTVGCAVRLQQRRRHRAETPTVTCTR